jgi:ubiquinone/menaquinone biosynthesis C-methylase UbiE
LFAAVANVNWALMSETPPSGYISDVARAQYGEHMAHWRVRSHVDKLVEEEFDFKMALLDSLQLAGDETILDIGCGDATDLKALRARGHQGVLVGLDIRDEAYPGMVKEFGQTQQAKQGRRWFWQRKEPEPEPALPFHYLKGEAKHLPLADNSVDVVMASFVLYHIDNPEDALAEINRVLKPGGKVAVATSGRGHKKKHRQLENEIANFIGIEEHQPMAATFTADIAEVLLPRFFNIVFRGRYSRQITLNNEQDVLDYVLSLDSSFLDVPPEKASRLSAARDELIKPKLRAKKKRRFKDSIDRRYYVGFWKESTKTAD